MRIDELTFFRFIAAAIVVIFHFGRDATGLEGILIAGPQMVTFFFVLSGFVLCISYLKKDVANKQFWWARVARIMPIYLLALAVMVWIIIRQGNPMDTVSLVFNALLLQAWFSPHPLSINPPGWSLSVEAFLYAMFPFVLYAIKKYHLTTMKIITLSLFIWLLTQAVLSYVLTKGYYGGFPSLSHDLIYYFPLSHLCSFLMGIAGGMWFIDQKCFIKNNFLSGLLACSAIVFVVVSINNQDQIARFFEVQLAFGSSFFALLFLILILAISICRSTLVGVLKSRPLLLLGEASFSFYILQAPVYHLYNIYISWHFGLSPLLNFIAYFCLLMLVSVFTFLLFEKPANKFLRYSLPKLLGSKLKES